MWNEIRKFTTLGRLRTYNAWFRDNMCHDLFDIRYKLRNLLSSLRCLQGNMSGSHVHIIRFKSCLRNACAFAAMEQWQCERAKRRDLLLLSYVCHWCQWLVAVITSNLDELKTAINLLRIIPCIRKNIFLLRLETFIPFRSTASGFGFKIYIVVMQSVWCEWKRE